jgi:hypothetical protein
MRGLVVFCGSYGRLLVEDRWMMVCWSIAGDGILWIWAFFVCAFLLYLFVLVIPLCARR